MNSVKEHDEAVSNAKENILKYLRIQGFWERRISPTFPPVKQAFEELQAQGYIPHTQNYYDKNFQATDLVTRTTVVREIPAHKLQVGFSIGYPCNKYNESSELRFFEVPNKLFNYLGYITNIQTKVPKRTFKQFVLGVKLKEMLFITTKNSNDEQTIVLDHNDLMFKER